MCFRQIKNRSFQHWKKCGCGEMADALDLESSEEIRESSSLSIRNKKFSFVLLPPNFATSPESVII